MTHQGPEWFGGVPRFVVNLALTLFIVGKALRAYRQHDSRPMLLFGIGFLFLLIVPPIATVPVHSFPPESWSSGTISTVAGVVREFFRLVGLGCIVSSLSVREG